MDQFLLLLIASSCDIARSVHVHCTERKCKGAPNADSGFLCSSCYLSSAVYSPVSTMSPISGWSFIGMALAPLKNVALGFVVLFFLLALANVAGM